MVIISRCLMAHLVVTNILFMNVFVYTGYAAFVGMSLSNYNTIPLISAVLAKLLDMYVEHLLIKNEFYEEMENLFNDR